MLRVIALASLVALVGCHRQADAPGDAPSNLQVEPGDGQVTVSWNQQPGLTYWIFFQAGGTVTAAAPGVPLIFDVQSPRVVFPLVNRTQYAFVMNATDRDSPGGPSTPVALAVPRLAGANWTPGAPLGSPPQNPNGVAYNPVLNKLVAVGNSAPGTPPTPTILAGDFNYTSASPPGVTAWTPATSIPAGFVGDLSAVMFSGSQFIALGTDGSILTSADGNTWILSANPVPSGGTTGPRMNSLAFGIVSGATIYVAVGNSGNIFTSADLVTWTTVSTTGNDLYNVSFPNGTFVATGANGRLLTSADANIWTPQISYTPKALRGATYGTGSAAGASAQYVVVGDSGTIVTSTDGTTWSPTTLPGLPNLRAIRFGTRFVAVGQEVVVGQGAAVVYSDDAINWSSSSVPGSADLAAITFTPAMYLAVGASGANAVSK
ncbi:MAG TPA: hypothetical protein VK583_03655 [Burkholderiales bacterium]|nr:hypothetical protein [Burkholderiales bacterium]